MLKNITEEQFFVYYLYFVILARIFGIYNGYRWLYNISHHMFPKASNQVTALFGRLFAIYTAVNCSTIFFLTMDPNNRTLYMLNMVVFFIAFFFFSTELYYFKTASTYGTYIVFFFAAGTSIYMATRWYLGWTRFYN